MTSFSESLASLLLILVSLRACACASSASPSPEISFSDIFALAILPRVGRSVVQKNVPDSVVVDDSPGISSFFTGTVNGSSCCYYILKPANCTQRPAGLPQVPSAYNTDAITSSGQCSMKLRDPPYRRRGCSCRPSCVRVRRAEKIRRGMSWCLKWSPALVLATEAWVGMRESGPRVR